MRIVRNERNSWFLTGIFLQQHRLLRFLITSILRCCTPIIWLLRIIKTHLRWVLRSRVWTSNEKVILHHSQIRLRPIMLAFLLWQMRIRALSSRLRPSDALRRQVHVVLRIPRRNLSLRGNVRVKIVRNRQIGAWSSSWRCSFFIFLLQLINSLKDVVLLIFFSSILSRNKRCSWFLRLIDIRRWRLPTIFRFWNLSNRAPLHHIINFATRA